MWVAAEGAARAYARPWRSRAGVADPAGGNPGGADPAGDGPSDADSNDGGPGVPSGGASDGGGGIDGLCGP